jgi:hypothetical protein
MLTVTGCPTTDDVGEVVIEVVLVAFVAAVDWLVEAGR